MYTNLYVYTALRLNMAKLYWRIKKNGKWTWRACSEQFLDNIDFILELYVHEWGDDDPIQEAVE